MDMLCQNAAADWPILARVQVRHAGNRLDAGQGSDVLQLLNSFAFDPGSARVESVDRRAAAHSRRIAHRTLSSEVNGAYATAATIGVTCMQCPWPTAIAAASGAALGGAA